MTLSGRRFLLATCILGAACRPQVFSREPEPLRVTATVALGSDRGENPGAIFELVDGQGRVVAGAGFLGAYNTFPRSDRTLLQFFLRPGEPLTRWRVERLPPVPSSGTGCYPFGLQNRLYVNDRGGSGGVFRWNAEAHRWDAAPELSPDAEAIAGKLLEKRDERILFDGRPLVDGSTTGERLAEHYFAGGRLFVRQVSGEGDSRINRVVVYSWNPDETPGELLKPNDAWTHPLSIPFEFFYTFGQWRDDVIGVTNVGTVLKFDGSSWTVLREPNLQVSYQVYCGINFYDSLLLGHYPSGEFFEYAGTQLARKAGWPPVLSGVATSARELQTAAIYGGELLAGVWPWGEVWRYDAEGSRWEFVQRMFAHPELTEAFQHPYEAETRRVETVANLWGQRVTGMVPIGDGLFITTSSKGGQPWDAKFDFLSPEKRADYGAVYRATLPGNLAVTTIRKPGPTTFEFVLADGRMTIRQDGDELGSVGIDPESLQDFEPSRIRWGRGIFGPFTGKLLDRSTNVIE